MVNLVLCIFYHNKEKTHVVGTRVLGFMTKVCCFCSVAQSCRTLCDPVGPVHITFPCPSRSL